MTKFKSQGLHITRIKYWKARGSGNPPSLIPTLWNIGILLHKKATHTKHSWGEYMFASKLNLKSQWAFGFSEISVWLIVWLVKDCIQLLLDPCRVLTKNIFSSRLKSTVMTGSIGFFLTWASFRFITWMMAFLARLRARGRSQFTLTRFCSLLTTYLPNPCWHLWQKMFYCLKEKSAYRWHFQDHIPTYLILST